MSWTKDWEVSLFAGLPDGLVMQRYFRSLRHAKRFMRKTLRKAEEIYCAAIWHEDTTLFYTYYWNGKDIIYWDKPWVLSQRQAANLDRDENGNIIVRSVEDSSS
jgi:hypothetical protein